MNTCQECGMVVKTANEYHPYAACLLFRACGNGDEVRAHLAAILQAATRDAPSADAVVQILKDEQQWLASSRDNCDEDELQRWDHIQVVIDYVAPKGDGND